MSDDSAAVAELHAAFKLQSAAFIKDQSPSLETRQGYLAKLAGMVSSSSFELAICPCEALRGSSAKERRGGLILGDDEDISTVSAEWMLTMLALYR